MTAQPTTDEMLTMIDESREKNKANLDTLRQRGYDIPTAAILHAKVDAIQEFMSPEVKVACELVFERNVSVILENALTETTKSKLILPDQK